MACLRHLVSALTNTDDILKVALCQTFVIEPVTLANLMTYKKADLLSLLCHQAITGYLDDILKVGIRQTFVIEPVTLTT